MMFPCLALQKPRFPRANTVVLARFCWFRCLHLKSSRVLSRGGLFHRLSVLAVDRYFTKIMLGCHVSFEQIFQKWCQFFVDNRLPLHPLFELKLKTFPLLHRNHHFVFTRKFLKYVPPVITVSQVARLI